MYEDDKYDVCPNCKAEGWMYQQIKIDIDHNDGITRYEQGQHYVWICAKCACEVGGR